jgi:hypothetical protein
MNGRKNRRNGPSQNYQSVGLGASLYFCTMYNAALRSTLFSLIEQQSPTDRTLTWLRDQQSAYEAQPTNSVFYRVFTAMPRFTGKAPVVVSDEMIDRLAQLRPGFQLVNWTLDRLARVWWLLHYPTDDQTAYVRSLSELFRSAEMNELVALYSALPVLAFPEEWGFLATEGIRNNIADVQAAIMLHNPYPAEQLDEAAWNQLVMKAFFTDKDVTQIVGLYERHNPRLKAILQDYAAERRAAGRVVPAHLVELLES